MVHPTLIPTVSESKKSYLSNWEDEEDNVDENIDRLTKVISGATWLVNQPLERHEHPEGELPVAIGRKLSEVSTEKAHPSQPSDKEIIELLHGISDEMKEMNKNFRDLSKKVEDLSGKVDELSDQVEQLRKKENQDENFRVDDDENDMAENEVAIHVEEAASKMVDEGENRKFENVYSTRVKRQRKQNPRYNSPYATEGQRKWEAPDNMKTLTKRKRSISEN